jgi:CBS domain-containing protein
MIHDRVSQEFFQLNLSDNLAAARKGLEENPNFVAVIIDNENKPVSIITRNDLVDVVVADDQSLAAIAGQFPPGLIVEAARPMEEFANSPEFATLSIGARGAIVLDRDQLAGVLTEAAITQYLRYEFTETGGLRGEGSLNTRLAGSIVNKPIIMYCEEFNHRNELDYYNRRNPPQCQDETPHPHPIRKKK